jgi:iron complex transport system ATP-binding protein
MDRMKYAIECRGVRAGYGRQMILEDVNLAIPEGDLLAILGPNGAGKSTFFKVLTGLHPLQAGEISLFGHPLNRLSSAERARLIAVVPQEVETPVAFSVAEIVLMGRTAILPRWTLPSAHDFQVVDRALVYTDVAGIKDRPFSGLSGGEKQRTIIAMALAQEPRLILMDEATSHLDINHRFEVMQIVERLNQESGVTVVMISHDLGLAADFCRRLVLFDHGRIAADGVPAAVLTDELLKSVYHCPIHVRQDSQTGALNIQPARRPNTSRAGRGIRVHVVAGGGAGEELMRHLALAGYSFSAGVLNRGDSDTQIAETLGAELACEKPFSPIGPEAIQKALTLAQAAQVVVLTDVPFGPGNLPNLDILEDALRRGHPVLALAGIESRDYSPGRTASRRLEDLVKQGALICPTIADLIAHLPSASPSEKDNP